MQYKIDFASFAERWLRKRGESTLDEIPFDIGDDGFLCDPLAGGSVSANFLVRPPDTFGDNAIVVLGEPGSGKSTTFRTMLAQSSIEPTVWINGSTIVDSNDYQFHLGQHLDDLPASGTETSTAPVVIVLDQLDESPFLPRLGPYLRQSLKGHSTKSLSILVGCRTADFQNELERVLTTSLDECLICDLAPLTRQDAASLVETAGIDPDRFLKQVDERRVGPLASIPLTLQLLAASFRENAGSLSQTPHQLFAHSALRLADEHDRSRTISEVASTPSQRLAVAERIAARMLLSGQRTVWTGEAALVESSDVTEQSLANGTENILGEQFNVTPRVVAETLATALFSRSNGRASFIHSSFAAFLCARYLVTRLDRRTSSRQQLDSIFLIAAPDEDSASIPVHLRETAAWLIELHPNAMTWLAKADPDGLMAHCAYVSGDESKATIVEALLDRAPEVELVKRGWQPVRWKIWHSGLGDQLRAALNGIAVSNLEGWDEFARARLAIDIARDCGASEALSSLISIANNASWPLTLRGRAARTAMESDPATAAPHLSEIFRNISPIAATGEEMEEFIGTLTDLLWPKYVDLSDVIRLVHPIREHHATGLYWWTMTRFPQLASEDDLGPLATFALESTESSTIDNAGIEVTPPADVAALAQDSPTPQRIPSETITSIIERLLNSPDWRRHVATIATLISRRIQSQRDLIMPVALSLVSADTQVEDEETRARRLTLAEAIASSLLEVDQEVGNFETYQITSTWHKPGFSSQRVQVSPEQSVSDRQRIIDSRDLKWLLERIDRHVADGQTSKATALGYLAGYVADLYDAETFELLYSRRDCIDWPRYSWFYDGIEVEGALAKSLRMNTQSEREWTKADAYARTQRENLDAAVSGDSDAFWQLVKNLAFDPKTGRAGFMNVSDMRKLPGAALWDAEQLTEQLVSAASRYLATEHDHRDTWLGLGVWDYRARAGLQAIQFLSHLDLISDLKDLDWDKWVGVIVDNFADYSSFSDDGFDARVLELATSAAAPALATSIRQLVRRSLARGAAVGDLRLLGASLRGDIGTVLLELAAEISAALQRHTIRKTQGRTVAPVSLDDDWDMPSSRDARVAAARTWSCLIDALLQMNDYGALDAAKNVLSMTANSKIRRVLGPAAGVCMLRTGLLDAWEAVRDEMRRGSHLSHDIARQISSNDLLPLSSSASEKQLVEVFDWLSGVVPPETEVWQNGSGPPEMRLHEARNFILSALVERGTSASVLAVRAIADRHPEDLRIRSSLIEARRTAQTKNAMSPSPEEVVLMLSHPGRRIVQTAMQLSRVVVEVLDRISEDLHSHSNLLWDGERGARPDSAPATSPRPVTWRPKPEGSLVAYLQNQLALRLKLDPVIVNREVLVNPTDDRDSGERADLLVQATTGAGYSDASPDVLSVPIEVKGSWNDEVPKAQRVQLAERYLPALGTDSGIYLVGWYDLTHWDSVDDHRKPQAKLLKSSDDLHNSLVSQADELTRERGCRTTPVILTIKRAIKAKR